MKVLVKETIWREIEIKENTSKDEIINFIENEGVQNIYDAEFYVSNELMIDTGTELYPEDNDGFSTVEIYENESDLIYANGKN